MERLQVSRDCKSAARLFILFSEGEDVSGPVSAKWDTSAGGGPCQTWLGPQSLAGQALAPW